MAAIPSDVIGNIKAIIGEGQSTFNDGSEEWPGTLNELEGLHGYWFFSDSEIDFSFNLVADGSGLARKAASSEMAETPLGLEFAQSSQQAFYYIDDIILRDGSLENGDWIISYCGSTLAGSRQYTGETVDVPVMGYDGHISTAGYCESGDKPQFKLLKSTTNEMIDLNAVASAWESNGIFFLDNVNEGAPIPSDFSMLSAYPNPFNPVTHIGFEVPTESIVQISIFDLKGQEVETLVNELTLAGTYSINWNANNVASGVYFVHFTASGDGFTSVSQIQKLMLIK
jgi:hypothetical protein